MNRTNIIVGIILSLLFAVLLSLYWDFVLDDAFITFRYAQNLINNEGLVWNVSEDPVEGYTSFLWVVINALFLYFHLDPVTFSKIISSLAALVIIWILLFASKKIDWWLVVVFVSTIALSPPFAFLTMQCMETAITTLFIVIAAQLSLVIMSNPSKRHIIYLYGTVLLGFLSRPDTAIFNGGLILGLITMFILKKDYKTFRIFLLVGFFFSLGSSLYIVWRFNYFGYLFPNSFYTKIVLKGGIIKSEGIEYFHSFIQNILYPYLVLIAFLLGKHLVKEKIFRIIPILLGCTFFCFYLLTVYPLQAFFWRYIFPVYPAFLLAIIAYCTDMNSGIFKLKRKWVSVGIVMFFLLFALRHLPDTFYQEKYRTQHDRVVVGKRLAGLQGVMFTTEAGALPYYSGWKAVDNFGLTSEEITHKGLSYETLKVLNPDLIVLHYRSGGYKPIVESEKITHCYMIEHDFIAVVAVHKCFDEFHYYFVRKNSALFQEIVKRLRYIKNLNYGYLEQLMVGQEIPYIPSKTEQKKES